MLSTRSRAEREGRRVQQDRTEPPPVLHDLRRPCHDDAATIPTFRFAAAVHVHYQEKVLPLRDGLPRFRDIPRAMGGSGEMLPE